MHTKKSQHITQAPSIATVGLPWRLPMHLLPCTGFVGGSLSATGYRLPVSFCARAVSSSCRTWPALRYRLFEPPLGCISCASATVCRKRGRRERGKRSAARAELGTQVRGFNWNRRAPQQDGKKGPELVTTRAILRERERCMCPRLGDAYTRLSKADEIRTVRTGHTPNTDWPC